MYATLLDTVNVQLSPVVLLTSLEKIPVYAQTILASQQAISSTLRNISYKEDVSEIVHKHQEELAKLSNLLFDFRKSLGKDHPYDASLDQFYSTAAKGFDDLLDYVIKEHPEAVHPTTSAPYSYVSSLRVEFTKMVKEVLVKAHGKPIDPELLKVVLEPIMEIINKNEKETVTQWSLFYCRELLTSLLWATASDGRDKRIYYALMHLNFNSYGYYFYCKQKLHRKLEELEDIASRKELLSWFKKEIHANQVKYSNIAFLPNKKSWATLMLTCIEEEQKFLQPDPGNKEVIIHGAEAEEGKTEEAAPLLVPKLNTSLSVSQLALMVRAYIDAGIITNISITESHLFITKMLTTKKKDELSQAAFKTQYYNPSVATIATCKRRLHEVLVKLSEYENK